jgi:hypothetical protein
MQRNRVLSRALGVLLPALALTFAAKADEVKGMIQARAGDTIVVVSGGESRTVVLNASTRVKDDKGLFGLDKQEFADTVLIPGLKVRIDGSAGAQGKFVAKTITVDGDDLETSEMIEAGLHPTAQQVAENVVNIENNRKGVKTNQQNIATNQLNIAAN